MAQTLVSKPTKLFDLTGRVALVTGGGRGIGAGIARCLARQGADVAITATAHPQSADAVAAELRAMGVRALVVKADVSSKADAERAVAEVVRQLGRLDILVNNAGILTAGSFLDMPEEVLDRTIAVNLKGQFLMGQVAAREMAKARYGRIINLSSIASGGVGIGVAGISAYTASKGGVIGMTETLAIELAPLGITVNVIAPGFIDTDMSRQFLPDQDITKAQVSNIAVGRPGTPMEVGAAAVFLASDEASYVTGLTLYVDGGRLAE